MEYNLSAGSVVNSVGMKTVLVAARGAPRPTRKKRRAQDLDESLSPHADLARWIKPLSDSAPQNPLDGHIGKGKDSGRRKNVPTTGGC
jgi:hypothetical protein